MILIRKGMLHTVTCLMVTVIIYSVSPFAAAFGEDVKEVRYARIEARRPIVISHGFLGMSEKPGMAYTIKLVLTPERLEIDSLNDSFLVGDCVAVVSDGEKPKLIRAEPQRCVDRNLVKKKTMPVIPGTHGPKSDQCAHARKEAAMWPPGPGRRRALLRELMICQPNRKVHMIAPLEGPCAKAWAKVEALPFGLERAAARQRAQEICGVAP